MLTISAAPSYSIPGQNSPDPKDDAAEIFLQGLPPNGAFREKRPGALAESSLATGYRPAAPTDWLVQALGF
jgi:hypothetical protein